VNTPSYGLLFSDMDPETAGEIVARLKTLKVSINSTRAGARFGCLWNGLTSCGSS
jgi:hypothetical protein